ncbi:MAG TPA: GNAT family N-acetyltransferase [Bryobacteraceae bacterium]|nr:GNAT family N-acetyltransferase [Bryobacteraceae bacterium]
MIVTDELARRLESAEALDAVACAEAACRLYTDCESSVLAAAGGFLTFCGATSPLTHALGVGLHGPVSATDVDEVESFFAERGCSVTIDVSPHADRTFLEELTRRNYRVLEMSNVLVRRLNAGEQFAVAHDVSPCEDCATYSQVVICGFFSREAVTDDEMRIGETLFNMPGAQNLIARIDGRVAGGSAMSARNGVASLFADAVLPDFRRRGVHGAMIAARLNRAVAGGCDVATAGTQPGSSSQRNYQRLGFEVAYTKITMVGPG